MHRKTQTLCEALNIKTAQAVGHLALLWLWALDNARPDGFLMGASPRTVARAAGWAGDPVRFVDALCDAGFLDGSMTIHDWEDYTGRFTDQRTLRRSSNRDAQARRRQRLRQQDVSTGHGDTSSVVIPGQQSTVPNLNVLTPPNPLSGEELRGVPKPKRVRMPISDQDTEALVAKYGDRYGSLQAVRDEIELALNHQARFKVLSERLYVDGWLRRELEHKTTRSVANGRTLQPASHRPIIDRTGEPN